MEQVKHKTTKNLQINKNKTKTKTNKLNKPHQTKPNKEQQKKP